MKNFIAKTLILILLLSQIVLANDDYPQAFSDLPRANFQRLDLNSLKTKNNKLYIKINRTNLEFDIQTKNKNINGDDYFQALSHDSRSSISATIGNASIFGKLHFNNDHYLISTDANGSWLIKLPNSGVSYNDCGVDHKGQNQRPASKQIINTLKSTPSSIKGQPNVVDIYMLYDQAMAIRYPGQLLQTRINQYFNVANQSLINSQVPYSVRLVGLELTTYNLSENNVVARNDIQRSLDGQVITGFESVLQRRNQLGADMVVLIRPHDIETRGNCGVAYFPVANTNQNGFDARFGVHVMSDGMSSWSICTDQLMIHELGHNFGAAHHNQDFTFLVGGNGYAKANKFSTIMGSFGTGQPERFMEIDTYSNPRIQCGGVPCGVAGVFDNTNVVNQIIPYVANYRQPISTLPIPNIPSTSNPDSDSDGVSDWTDAFPFDPTEFLDSDDDGVGDNKDAFPTNPNEQYDTDGDSLGNNSDQDDDGDGSNDDLDFFPLDPNEDTDSDFDLVGDNSDAFPFNISEQSDFDFDGIGDHEDLNDDNDEFIDSNFAFQDLLILSVGSNQILRFDASSGASKGIELLSKDGMLTFQSDMSYREDEQLLFYSSLSGIKGLDLSNRNPLGELVPPYARNDFQQQNGIQLFSGFPTSLTNLTSGSLLITTLENTFARVYSGSKPYYSFSGWYFENNLNIIDTLSYGNQVYFLDQSLQLYKGSSFGSVATLGSTSNQWMNDPYAFAINNAGTQLYITNQASHEISKVSASNGAYQGEFANLADFGYSNPTGIAITQNDILLVAAHDQNAILKFNLSSGEFLGELVSNQGINQPFKIELVPQLNDRFNHDADKVIRPNAGLWYNQATSGRGFDIQIFNNRLSVIWYTYDENGLPIWYISSGELNGFEYTGVFNKTHLNDDETFSLEEVGSITINFENERKAQVSWQIDESSGSEPIQWLTWSTQETLDERNYTGLWGRPDGPGWGVSVATIGGISIAIPYLYDSKGEPRWLISDPVSTTSPLNFSMNATFSDTLCPSCSGVSEYTTQPSGSMVMTIGEEKSWDSDIDFPTPLDGEWNLKDTDLRLFSDQATRPR